MLLYTMYQRVERGAEDGDTGTSKLRHSCLYMYHSHCILELFVVQ